MMWIRRHMMNRHRGHRGQVMVIFALMFVVLMAFAGLALDATHLYLVQHTAQKAADAAALAAGKRLAGATQQSPIPDSNALAAIAAHDFAGADGFITTRSTACDRTTTVGSLTRFTTTWYDVAGVSCGASSGFNNAVTIAVPPFGGLTPHCTTTPYNCMQVMIQSQVQNLIMGSVGFATSTVGASATVFAQPSGIVYNTPPPLAFYLYEAPTGQCGLGYQCFDRTKAPTRSMLSCGGTANCPTYWVQNGAGTMMIGVDGATLNPPADTVAAESNGDMVIGDRSSFCDPYGGVTSQCAWNSPVGAYGFAINPSAVLYCSGFGGGYTATPVPCTTPGPGAYSITRVYGNETSFSTKAWTPRFNLAGLPTCGTVVLNGDPVANSGSTCPPPASEPYNLLPGIYQSIVVNHGTYTFEPGVYDITGKASVNTATSGKANGIDHSRENSRDWDLCTNASSSVTACGGANPLTAGVWIGYGSLASGPLVTTVNGTCAGAGTTVGGGGDLTSISGQGVVFRFEQTSAGFVSTSEIDYIGLNAPGLGQEQRVAGAPLLFDMENDSFIHIDSGSGRQSDTPKLNSFNGIIYQYTNARAGGVEVNPGSPSRYGEWDGGTTNAIVSGQIFAYSLTTFGGGGTFNFSNGTGGAATPTVTTSGIQENQILVSSTLVAGATPTTESIVIKYQDEWALDAYDAYVKINNGSPIYFSDGIWNPRPTSGQTLPPNALTNIPSDSNPAKPTGLEVGAGRYTRTTTTNGDPKWTMTYPVGGIYGPANGSTFTVEGNWTWGHERDLLTAIRGNDLATLTYTFPVPAGQTVTVSMFMTDGDRCGDYVTSTWTFNNIGQPAPGVQVVGSVRLEG
jgi:Flp pilus assembly protein TadG